MYQRERPCQKELEGDEDWEDENDTVDGYENGDNVLSSPI